MTAPLPPPLEYRMYTRDELQAFAKLAVREALERAAAEAKMMARAADTEKAERQRLEAELQRLTPTAEDQSFVRTLLANGVYEGRTAGLLRRYVLREE
jgi:hypothetical protein